MPHALNLAELNIIETEPIETARYSNKVYFAGECFYIFEKLLFFAKINC